MTFSVLPQTSGNSQIAVYFKKSAGEWRSERRYYTLPHGDTKEMISHIQVRYLEEGSPELLHLAQLHQLSADTVLHCGAEVSWHSEESVSGKKQSRGSTLFGALGDILYRDRGFATPKPVTANFYFPNPDTLCLRTEYQSSSFEEEVKLIGQRYRTRQTIITREGEQQMIGQYLETRIA
ncbi:phycobiliprotein lyase [Leptolyngbya sp. AN02str]|uniref:phycobiliprotein lyase n=1 Tax=Leptolyngbya sp. AN02str TaxID=3423363 RepID=UPI003D31B4E6